MQTRTTSHHPSQSASIDDRLQGWLPLSVEEGIDPGIRTGELADLSLVARRYVSVRGATSQSGSGYQSGILSP